MKQQINPYPDHHELTLLLPWYVNRTLQESEMRAVEAHLSVCLTCKRELMQLQKLAHAVNSEGALDSSEKIAFTHLKLRLHGQSQAPGLQQKTQSGQANKSFYAANSPQNEPSRDRFTRMRAHYPALAMAAVILLSVILVVPHTADDGMQLGNTFKTLSDAQHETSSSDEIRVVFADNVNQQQKDNLLGQIHGQIMDDPTDQGVYTVKLAKEIAPKNLLDIVAFLRKDNRVIFAEPAYALLSSMHVEMK